MHGPSNLKTSNNPTIHPSFNNMKPPLSPSSSSSSSSSSSLNSTKLKTLLQTFVFSRLCNNIARALARAKLSLVQLLKDVHYYKNDKRKKLFFGSFRLHYNWGSTSSNSYVYYDSSWSSALHKVEPLDYDEIMQECEDTSELSNYLHWLEERGGARGDEECCNEIDRLADMFIADCHEKFRLEKQDSYRKFQEMMARSV